MRRPAFDPHDHLVSQGWKGKGTGEGCAINVLIKALRDGHAKRPIPVVQKKTLAGIGKDRDEAIPFWDHIFASTAASLASSTSPSASGTSTPIPKPAPVISIAARSGKEIAKRKLYSSFLRGTVISTPLTDDEAEESESAVEAVVEVTQKKKDKGKGKEKEKDSGVEDGEKESKEERRARKLRRKEEKEAKVAARAAKEQKKAVKALQRKEKEERRAAKRDKKAKKGKDKA